MSNVSENRVRIPVKLVDGKWEFFYGGTVPIAEETLAEIVVDKTRITDQEFLNRLKKKTSYKIMEPGTKLFVALTIKSQSIDVNLRTQLQKIDIKKVSVDKRFSRYGVRPETRFVEIIVGDASKRDVARNKSAQGGVWLELEGMDPQGLTVSTLKLPEGITDEEVDSLNYAFTLLSDKFEPWRRSHTGNVYERIFYQEENGILHPLNVLRNAAIASEEQKFIRRQWQDISRQLNLNV
jgi:hypothetical protein